jgi:hypothetical protein
VTGNPVGVGLVASPSRPGGNVTGLSLLSADYNRKWLGLLKAPLRSSVASPSCGIRTTPFAPFENPRARQTAPPWTKWSERRVPLGGHSPKICGSWRSSSPSQRRSSPHEAERRDFASLTTAPTAGCGRPNNGFFNTIRPKRPANGGFDPRTLPARIRKPGRPS